MAISGTKKEDAPDMDLKFHLLGLRSGWKWRIFSEYPIYCKTETVSDQTHPTSIETLSVNLIEYSKRQAANQSRDQNVPGQIWASLRHQQSTWR